MFFIDSNENNSKHTADDINSANEVLLLDCCVKISILQQPGGKYLQMQIIS